VAGVSTNVPPHVKHGSSNAYGNYKCRCDLCRRGQGIRNREYRLRDPERFRKQRREEYAANPRRFIDKELARIKKKRLILERYKLLKGCARCGYREHPRALEFHHRVPSEKEFTVSTHLSRSMKRIKTEVRKCDVLCSNCHRIEEAEKWAI